MPITYVPCREMRHGFHRYCSVFYAGEDLLDKVRRAVSHCHGAKMPCKFPFGICGRENEEPIMGKTRGKGKKQYYILIAAIGVLLIALGYFFQFTPLGYRMTVPYRNFIELQTNVYVDSSYSGDREEVLAIVKEAKDRVSAFWGGTESFPTIIISDNERTTAKLGGDHDTQTAILFQVHSYLSVSKEYLNADIVAHELTHAELHKRLYDGKLRGKSVPIWFDEGIALQNDFREKYSEDSWLKETDNGSNIINLDEMDTASEFYAGDSEDRRLRYLISRQELKIWIEKNSMEQLIELVNRINSGEDFQELYYSLR